MLVRGVKGVENLSIEQVRDEVDRGAKFIQFEYCISLLVLTLKRRSTVYFVKADQNAIKSGLPYVFISFILGWWGIPWGPIYTISSIAKNFSGGEDITLTIMSQLLRSFDAAPRAGERTFRD